MFNDDWATSHLNTKALFAVIGLGVILIWSLILKDQQDSRTFLRTDQMMLPITDIKTTTSTSSRLGDQTTYFVTLKLPDDKHIKFMMSQKPPKVGTKVPVSVDVYEDGDNFYNYDRMEWMMLNN